MLSQCPHLRGRELNRYQLAFNPVPLEMVYGIISGMALRIDRAGRIVLPKRVRERLQLRGGSELELEEGVSAVTLRPVRRGPSMSRKKGFWVHAGKLPKVVDWESLIDESREERIRELSER